MNAQNKAIPPTGGWKQYNTAVGVLVAFPMIMLLCALLGLLALPRYRPTAHAETATETSREPFHLSLSVLPPLHTRDTAGQYPPPQNE